MFESLDFLALLLTLTHLQLHPHSILIHDSPHIGDLYIRGVRFSPDGKYLATGADDGLIRVGLLVSSGLSNWLFGFYFQ